MQKESDVKLQKHCSGAGEGEQGGGGEPAGGPSCVQCFCRPMWCLECMGKWFASRQDQQHPETWLGGKAPCPTCRAVFCMLDVSKIVRQAWNDFSVSQLWKCVLPFNWTGIMFRLSLKYIRWIILSSSGQLYGACITVLALWLVADLPTETLLWCWLHQMKILVSFDHFAAEMCTFYHYIRMQGLQYIHKHGLSFLSWGIVLLCYNCNGMKV